MLVIFIDDSRVGSMARYYEHFLNMPTEDAKELYDDHKRNLKVLGWKQGSKFA